MSTQFLSTFCTRTAIPFTVSVPSRPTPSFCPVIGTILFKTFFTHLLGGLHPSPFKEFVLWEILTNVRYSSNSVTVKWREKKKRIPNKIIEWLWLKGNTRTREINIFLLWGTAIRSDCCPSRPLWSPDNKNEQCFGGSWGVVLGGLRLAPAWQDPEFNNRRLNTSFKHSLCCEFLMIFLPGAFFYIYLNGSVGSQPSLVSVLEFYAVLAAASLLSWH